MLKGRIVRVRMVKNYSTAHNHVAVGEVLEETPNYIKMNCRSFHFGNRSGRLVSESESAVRILPWQRIEVIAELQEKVDWQAHTGFDEGGNLVLLDEKKTLVARSSGDRLRAVQV